MLNVRIRIRGRARDVLNKGPALARGRFGSFTDRDASALARCPSLRAVKVA
jgi:hypothetical protein